MTTQQEGGRKPVMVFVSNLRTLSDMVDLYPPEWHERVQEARLSPGYISSPAFDIRGVATGYLVLMLRSGEEVVKNPGAAALTVLAMTRCAAEDLDADVIGLGSLTTSVTKGGRMVADYIDANGWKLRATHGDTGSVAAIRQCMEMAGVTRNMVIAVVGAYGVIGSALTHMLAPEHPLILVGPQQEKLLELATSVRNTGSRLPDVLSTRLASVRDADCVITVTSHHKALLKPEHVKPGAVIIDPAIPANVCRADWQTPAGPGNVVISNASQVRVPGVAVRSSMFGTYDDPDGCATTYACLAETMLNAVYGDTSHHVGPIEPDFIRTTARRFAGSSFSHAVPRMFGSDCRQELAARKGS